MKPENKTAILIVALTITAMVWYFVLMGVAALLHHMPVQPHSMGFMIR